MPFFISSIFMSDSSKSTDVLIVFFSRSGHTKYAAKILADIYSSAKKSADMHEITDNIKRTGILGFIKSGRESIKKICPPINPLPMDVAKYSLVIVGTPLWGGTMASPVRTFLTQYGPAIKQIAFFVMSGGPKAPDVFTELETVAKQKPKASVHFIQKEIKTGAIQAKADEFVKKLI